MEISKEELIAMLEGLNNHLEKLDTSLSSKLSAHKIKWVEEQEGRIGECGKLLDQLERKMANVEKNEDNTQHTKLELKLSF